MFVKNAWYCAGWDYEISQGKDAIVKRKIAGEDLVLYRKPDGGVVAMVDRCAHRMAALSMGAKEGDSLRCMYHGLRFGPDGKCTEVPGQDDIPAAMCVRTFPVVEKDNWVWVWMGDAAKADTALICHSVGPSDPDWNIKTDKVRIESNYRLEIANLMDLTHITYTHRNSFGGTGAYALTAPEHTVGPRGVDTRFILRSVPAPIFAQHLFPPGMLFDLDFDITVTVPCNWVMHFRVFVAGDATDGDSNGPLLLDTWTCQAVTPRDKKSVDYYYSWGAAKTCEFPGLSDLLHEAINVAFLEDKATLEAQQRAMDAHPDATMVDIAIDEGPGKLFWVLDRLLAAEAVPA
jgi:phenylpropionate dioxygenase-like ring-hydroxylating dioxygenase large terminal subunit